ncbi:hypothetical protein O1D97_05975 [Marinomonas sp. 15G1-11]|uniref:Uncharacterized protein n=1 Tax=Marinomonas phaeophyticola TaxID=3004091 RepID=A0ABT4JS50_9GAMM|nr:hypothetical protein [Marinomonas sp. 15G1-11]MCZ2721208.1 hypothetical protein [Marinomonas sp. 15G1-11]
MIDLNSTNKTIGGLSTAASTLTKELVKEEKLEKGTELVSREAIDINSVSELDEKEKESLFLEVKKTLKNSMNTFL